MKVILIAAPILFAILAAILTILVIGAFLPRRHLATRSVRLAASPARVWELIADIPARAAWSPGVASLERLPDRDGHPVWKENRSDGWGMSYAVEALEPPTRLVTRIADDKLPFGGTWTWEVTPDADGSRLRITEQGEIKVAAFRYFAALGDMSSNLRGVLSAAAAKLGESPAIEP